MCRCVSLEVYANGCALIARAHVRVYFQFVSFGKNGVLFATERYVGACRSDHISTCTDARTLALFSCQCSCFSPQ